MAFDKDRHEFDHRGFLVEKDTGEIMGQKERWLVKLENEGAEYPKWIHRPNMESVLVNDEVEEERLFGHKEEYKEEEVKKPEVVWWRK